MHKVGIDFGRSMVKATRTGDSVLEFPPVLARVSGRTLLGAPGMGAQALAYDGSRWATGEDARGAEGARWLTDERKTGLDMVVLALGALGRLGVGGTAVVCAGVPASLWSSDGPALRRSLAGRFEFSWGPDRRAVSVIPYVLPEPAGAYFFALLDGAGRVADPGLARVPVAVVDVGYRSVDIVLIDGGAMRPHVTRSTAHGTAMAFERLYARISSRVGLLSDDERMDAFLAVVRGQPLVLKGRELDGSLAQSVESARQAVADAVISDVRSALSGANYKVLLWAGGGAEWLRRALDGAFPGGMWVAEPRLANVRGFYRYAVMAASRPARTAGE
jgi:hypothetical protein